MSQAASTTHEDIPHRGLITIAIMLATIMQVLDTTIANVAIPHMQSALGANAESVTWVLTSYIIASAVAMPATGWLGDRLAATLGDGRRFGIPIVYSHEGTPLETAGGIRRALPLLGDAPFVLVNGDIWAGFDLSRLVTERPDPVHLVLVDNPDHHPGGDFHLTERGRVRDNGEPRLTYAGMGRFDPALFRDLPDGEAKLAPLLRAATSTPSG